MRLNDLIKICHPLSLAFASYLSLASSTSYAQEVPPAIPNTLNSTSSSGIGVPPSFGATQPPAFGSGTSAPEMPNLNNSSGSGTTLQPTPQPLQQPPTQPTPQPAPTTSKPALQPMRGGGTPNLPTGAGQYYEEYDLKPYTGQLKGIDHPQQAVVDWILRETGTDVWFSDPFGFMNADRNTLRVYHTKEMHEIVRSVHERFVNGTTETQVYGLRLITINNPNWRTRAISLMRSVQAQTPGVEAWLVSKENTAVLLSMMRGRADIREINTVDIVTYNGQPQVLEQIQGRNYVRGFQKIENVWPPYSPETAEIQEGYRLQVSPLLSMDHKSVDVVLKCHIDQVEQLKNVNLDLPLPTGQAYTAQINVPQVASWRLHERFRWPSDQVLVLSCGVVAAPAGANSNTLLGQSSTILGLEKLIPGRPDRADALLIIEYKGNASSHLVPTTNTAQQPLNSVSRGRY